MSARAEDIDSVPFASSLAIRASTAELVRPPRRIRVSDAATRYVRLAMPGGYHGPWDVSLTPYMVEPMDALESRDHEAVIFAGPAQSGKTQALLDCWIGYMATCDPSDMMIVQTSQVTARDYSRRRVDRMHRSSPEIATHLSPHASDDNLHDKTYRSGAILTIGWPSISQLSGRAIRRMALTDYDRMPDDVDGEGDAFGLSVKRTTTFLSAGMTLAESSPGWEVLEPTWRASTPHEAPPTLGILALYNRGDRRRWYWPCPHCGAGFMPTWERLSWLDLPDPVAAAESAVMGCPHCGGVIPPDQRRELNQRGRWLRDGETWQSDGTITGNPRRSSIASFWMQGPAASFQSWSSLVLRYLQAMADYQRTGSEESLKTTVNTDQGRPYLPQRAGKIRRVEDLQARAESWDRGFVPPGVRFLIAAVDTQAAHWVVQVMGSGPGFETWLIDRYDLRLTARLDDRGEPAQVDPAARQEDWQLLATRVLASSYPLADGSGRRLPVRLLAVDSGGRLGVTTRAYEFWRWASRRGLGRRIMLIKGEASAKDSAQLVRISYPDKRPDREAAAGDVPLHLVNTRALKDALDGALKRTEPGPGYVHLPDWLPEPIYEELTAEIKDPRKGWQKVTGSARNEAWDLLVYGRAAVIQLGALRWGDHWETAPTWAQTWERNPDLTPAAAPPVQAPQVAHSKYLQQGR